MTTPLNYIKIIHCIGVSREYIILNTIVAALMAVLLLILIIVFLTLVVGVARSAMSSYWLTPRRIKKAMERQGVCGPTPKFLVGNIPDIDAIFAMAKPKDSDVDSTISHDIVGHLLPHYLLWSKQFGKRFIFWIGREPRMCLTEINLIRELLMKHSTTAGRSWMQRQGTKHFIGEGLLMANGADWHNQRHLVAPVFSGDKLKRYAQFMVELTEKMMRDLESAVRGGQTELEIGQCMTQLTADIISRFEFGSSHAKGKQIFHLLKVLQDRCAESSHHFCFPGSRFFPSKYNREISSLKMETERLLMEIIQSRRESVEAVQDGNTSYGDDLLGMLLNEMHEKKVGGAGGSDFNVCLQLIMDECKTFFFAGHETTAVLLAWTIMLLASNPSWQQKVREEVVRVCGGQPIGTGHLPKLSLLSMVINESMRLYPPALILPRMALEDIKLGDLFIPKGLSVWIPVLAFNHSEELWGEDADDFNPGRFSSESCSPGKFTPFAMGPRNCIGQSFAMIEAKIILAMLISRFSFTISENYRHAPVVVLTLKPKYGVQVCLKPL
ncbi:hypothetical protein SAY86_007103 [Trapa natans]|uniref:Uncharacterized protein n=1 Tax=Trapa natans TaxID=22666 RepID=A0AAN7LEC8_TRANT|nr:hypothetical protein SAY86_007103 [Trapa natans]